MINIVPLTVMTLLEHISLVVHLRRISSQFWHKRVEGTGTEVVKLNAPRVSL